MHCPFYTTSDTIPAEAAYYSDAKSRLSLPQQGNGKPTFPASYIEMSTRLSTLQRWGCMEEIILRPEETSVDLLQNEISHDSIQRRVGKSRPTS